MALWLAILALFLALGALGFWGYTVYMFFTSWTAILIYRIHMATTAPEIRLLNVLVNDAAERALLPSPMVADLKRQLITVAEERGFMKDSLVGNLHMIERGR